MRARSIMREPAIRGILGLCLLNLFLFTQILTLRADLHHRFHGHSGIEKEIVAKVLLQGPLDLPPENPVIVPYRGRVIALESQVFSFSSFTSHLVFGRGPPPSASC